MNYQRVFPIFSVTFAVVYAICFYFGGKAALFAYYPARGEATLSPLTLPIAQTGPAMFWYGWVATSVIAALIVSAIALVLPALTRARVWASLAWVAPILSFFVLWFLERDWFMH